MAVHNKLINSPLCLYISLHPEREAWHGSTTSPREKFNTRKHDVRFYWNIGGIVRMYLVFTIPAPRDTEQGFELGE